MGQVMRNVILGLVALTGLSACYGKPLTWEQNPVAVQRWYAESFQDQPFDVGNVSVITEERGEMRTYLLSPCRNNTRVCGSRAGTLERTPDFSIVTGAYPGRVFYLSPGGDGSMVHNGRTVPLAWNE